jgi:alpha-L-fucosidase
VNHTLTLLAALLLAPLPALHATESTAAARALADPAAAHLAKPTPGQIEWADMELEMFVHFGVATWKGQEYDENGKMDLSKMNPAGFDAEQICQAAKSWDAKQVILVCKHVGGFCWWPTETTDYCVRSIPWKDGKGNLVKEVADACRRHGLKLGIYIYSDDVRYTKAIGKGGRTDDPAKQEEWNAKLRQQWTEVLTLCGPDLVREIWFDGGCIVPLHDIIEKLAPNAEIFGGPHATVRWPGSESGKLPYPCWSSMAPNSDGAIGDPDGSKWLPPECDTVLYGGGGHNWFWSPQNEQRRHPLPKLMDIYLKSVGRGGVLLLNSSPNTNGLIPAGDRERYREFGAEIQRRFGNPLAQTNGVGDTLELDLRGAKKVNQAWIMEDTRGGHRIRSYALEGRNAAGQWQTLAEGSSVGHKRIEVFAEATVDKLRLRITKNVGTPIVRDLAAFYADGIESVNLVRALTEGRPTTASSTHSAPYVPGMATDGSSQTRWGAKDVDTNAWLEVDLGQPQSFGKMVIRELGDRIREFVIEHRSDTNAAWQVAFSGGPVGRHYTQEFPAATGRYARLRVVQGGKLGPTLWEFELWPGKDAGSPCGGWAKGAASARLDLTPHIKMPATYEVTVGAVKIASARLLFNGAQLPAEDCAVKEGKVIVRQTQQVTTQTKTELELTFAPGAPAGNAAIRMTTER